MMNSGKRKREDFASQYQNNGFIPQQDGAGDAANSVFEIEVLFLTSCQHSRRSFSALYLYANFLSHIMKRSNFSS